MGEKRRAAWEVMDTDPASQRPWFLEETMKKMEEATTKLSRIETEISMLKQQSEGEYHRREGPTQLLCGEDKGVYLRVYLQGKNRQKP